ncbi:MAG TPA: COX15/CtaA family protein [Acidimicrobiales bacterium]|nr:COX15/CtaA family protein [Acidimicrobiales bacterium]
MALPSVSPASYRRITLFAVLALAFIVLTGAAVRLTGSGLGCSDWPTCEQGRLGPGEITDAPAMIEFVNRLITGLVSVAVILAVAGAARRIPRRRDLVWLAAGLVAGVLGQIVLGGLVVLFELSPRLVMGHFLVSMLLLWNAVVLHHRAGRTGGPVTPLVGRSLVHLTRAIFVVGALVVFTGTVVTASGPHAGDSQAARLGLDVPDVARVHGIWVVALVVLTLVLTIASARQATPPDVQRASRLLLGVLAGQAAVGYTQYFTGVPALLVGVHILGAIAVWIAVVHVNLVVSGPPAADPAPLPRGDRARPVASVTP